MIFEAELEQILFLGTIPNRKTLTKIKTQRLFLKEIEQHVPSVLKSLHGQVYGSLYDSLFHKDKIIGFSDKTEDLTDQTIIKAYTDKYPNHGLTGTSLEAQANRFWGSHNESLTHWYGSSSVSNSNYPELIPLYEKVKKWSMDNHLDADWIRETAINTLLGWTTDEEDELEISFHWRFPGWGRSKSLNEDAEVNILASSLSPTLLRYFPLEETSKKYLEKLEKFILKKIETDHILSLLPKSQIVRCILIKAKDYCKKINNYYLENGCQRISPKPQLKTHVGWAIEVQINGSSYSKIATRDKNDIANVSRSIERLLNSIGLPLRSDISPGRPKGKKDSKTRTYLHT